MSWEDLAAQAPIRSNSSPRGIEAELRVSLPGLTRREAEALVEKAHIVCHYSNATRGNIDVRLMVL